MKTTYLLKDDLTFGVGKAAIAMLDRNFAAGARIELETLISQSLYMLNVLRNNWVKVHDPKNKGDNEKANVLY
jgi:hypothetical protein